MTTAAEENCDILYTRYCSCKEAFAHASAMPEPNRLTREFMMAKIWYDEAVTEAYRSRGSTDRDLRFSFGEARYRTNPTPEQSRERFDLEMRVISGYSTAENLLSTMLDKADQYRKKHMPSPDRERTSVIDLLIRLVP